MGWYKEPGGVQAARPGLRPSTVAHKLLGYLSEPQFHHLQDAANDTHLARLFCRFLKCTLPPRWSEIRFC